MTFRTRFAPHIAEGNALARLAGPTIVAGLSQLLMGFVDTVMAGQTGAVSLAGVSLGLNTWVIPFVTLFGLLSAIGPFIANHYGAKTYAQIPGLAMQGIWLALICGVLVVLLLLGCSQLFHLTGAQPEVVAQARVYLYGMIFGTPAALLFRVLTFYSASVSLTRPMMVIGLGSLLLNIPLNWLLIYGHWGLPAMGGAGCGWASGISMWAGFFVMLWHVRRHRNYASFRLPLRLPRPDWSLIKPILRLGATIGVTYLFEVAAFASVSLFLASLGAEVVAGHQIVMNFAALMFMVPSNLGHALTVRIGQHIGAGRPDQARRVSMVALLMVSGFALLSGSLMFLFPMQIASLYTSDHGALQVAIGLLPIGAAFQLGDCLQAAAGGGLRGYKVGSLPMWIMGLSFWVIAVPLGYWLAFSPIAGGAPLGARGFWYGLTAGLFVAALLLTISLLRVNRQRLVAQSGHAH
ncbi:MATE family efflux transporter [Leeia aquatica]|uniref:Multidrug-efflux transporter n=1 Tax=Leeia aquatica TaxID=2725557 RepID=A0A847SGQ7_9NEIS|nr:MATE family efflux transporter [Leeia aquatica]NLR76389.1 MATE family efflux transporter [Leeia aquatica]